MAQVKVWNDNSHDYRDKFKGEAIFIPAKKFIVMEAGEAQQFVCAMPGFSVAKDFSGTQDPRTFKMLRVEKISSKEDPLYEDVHCHVCNFSAPNKTALSVHLREHAELQAATQEMLKAERLDKAVYAEEQDLAHEAMAVKKPRGRPRKKETASVQSEFSDKG